MWLRNPNIALQDLFGRGICWLSEILLELSFIGELTESEIYRGTWECGLHWYERTPGSDKGIINRQTNL